MLTQDDVRQDLIDLCVGNVCVIQGLRSPTSDATSRDVFVATCYRVVGTGDRRAVTVEVGMSEDKHATNTFTWASKEGVGQRFPVISIEKVRENTRFDWVTSSRNCA